MITGILDFDPLIKALDLDKAVADQDWTYLGYVLRKVGRGLARGMNQKPIKFQKRVLQ